MDFIRKLINFEEYDRIIVDVPLESVLVTGDLILKMDKEFNIDDLNMNTEQFVKFTELKYWLQLVEYDLTCTHGCLVYLTYLMEKGFFKSPNNKKSIMKVQDFSFFFDSAFNKLFSLIERVSQFVNCLFSLELIENKLGVNGVSIKNVIRKLQERELLIIKDCIDYIDHESENLRKTRNAITHHFHPLNSPFLVQSIVNGVLKINEANLHPNNIIDKELISTFQNSFNNINDMINMLVGVAIGFFKIDCVIIKNKTVVDVVQLRMGFES